MTVWEYCQITWMQRMATEAEVAVLEANQIAVQVQRDPAIAPQVMISRGHVDYLAEDPTHTKAITDLREAIATLGRDGWELVSHTPKELPTKVEVFFFKRPQHTLPEN